MGLCISKQQQVPYADKPTKVRIFHVFPFSDHSDAADVLDTIQKYIHEAESAGLTVTAAMDGGMNTASSIATAEAIRNRLTEHNVALEFDTTCANREEDTPLGVVILDNGSVQFVDQVVTSNDSR